jgi:hypothetical protein
MLRYVERFSEEDFGEYGLAPVDVPPLLTRVSARLGVPTKCARRRGVPDVA